MTTYAEIAASLPDRAVREIDGIPFPKIASGKVREIFDLGDRLLMVASDRLSAFDVILPDGIPGKGILLTQLSRFWFEQTRDLVADHLLPDQESILADELKLSRDMRLRSMVVRKLKPLPIECVVRGYLAGSGWSSYKKSGDICGVKLPAGLVEAQQLPDPIFTPSTKATSGHDEPIGDAEGEKLIGKDLYHQVRLLSLDIYRMGRERAESAGMILADTKFEFGIDDEGGLYLIDEVLTPDSSRYWDVATYKTGMSPASFDKQFVRDYLLTLGWDRQPPGPALPAEIIQKTRAKYLSALARLME